MTHLVTVAASWSVFVSSLSSNLMASIYGGLERSTFNKPTTPFPSPSSVAIPLGQQTRTPCSSLVVARVRGCWSKLFHTRLTQDPSRIGESSPPPSVCSCPFRRTRAGLYHLEDREGSEKGVSVDEGWCRHKGRAWQCLCVTCWPGRSCCFYIGHA